MQEENYLPQDRHHRQSHLLLRSLRRCLAGPLRLPRHNRSYLQLLLLPGPASHPAPHPLLRKKLQLRHLLRRLLRHLTPRHHDGRQESIVQVKTKHRLFGQRRSIQLSLGAQEVAWLLSGGETLHFCTALCVFGGSDSGLLARLLARAAQLTVKMQIQPFPKRRAKLICSENIDRTAHMSCAQQRSLPCLSLQPMPRTQGFPPLRLH